MKKFFLFAAAVVAAMTVNATVFDFAGITADQITVDAQGAKGTYTMDAGTEKEQTVPSVNYTSTVGALMNVSISTMSNFSMQYKNGSESKDGHKDNILKFTDEYMQADGKNVVMVFTGLKMDDLIILAVSAKGSTAATFDSPDASATADPSNPASVAKDDGEKIVKFYSNGSTASIKETAGGFRVSKIYINEYPAGIDNTNAAVKVEKFYRDGQLIIRKNGVEYNALGVKL